VRHALIVLVIAVCIGLHQGCFAQAHERLALAALSEDATLAMQLRCDGQPERARRECREMLKKLYLSGTLDPDKTLRSHCRSIRDARWGGSRPPPPPVCVERYGGWRGAR
jgi:hypothetical protein